MVRGRADDVIISGGEKIVADEVEQVLRGCPQVREAVVVGAPDPDWGERVTVMLVAADDAAPPRLDDLRAYVRDRLPRYAAPQAMVVVSELPMLASGKPDRQLIREMAARRAGPTGPAADERTPLSGKQGTRRGHSGTLARRGKQKSPSRVIRSARTAQYQVLSRLGTADRGAMRSA